MTESPIVIPANFQPILNAAEELLAKAAANGITTSEAKGLIAVLVLAAWKVILAPILQSHGITVPYDLAQNIAIIVAGGMVTVYILARTWLKHRLAGHAATIVAALHT